MKADIESAIKMIDNEPCAVVYRGYSLQQYKMMLLVILSAPICEIKKRHIDAVYHIKKIMANAV